MPTEARIHTEAPGLKILSPDARRAAAYPRDEIPQERSRGRDPLRRLAASEAAVPKKEANDLNNEIKYQAENLKISKEKEIINAVNKVEKEM